MRHFFSAVGEVSLGREARCVSLTEVPPHENIKPEREFSLQPWDWAGVHRRAQVGGMGWGLVLRVGELRGRESEHTALTAFC